jgi:two-component system NtrC family sensor kinase
MAELEMLKQKLAARDKTIAALIARAEGSRTKGGSSVALLDLNASLERLVAQRTEQIEGQRRELETALAELRSAQAELVQANKLTAIGQLAAGIAHEINTPVQYASDNTAFLGHAFTSLLRVVKAAEQVSLSAEASAVEPQRLEELRQALKKAKVGYLAEQVPKAVEQASEGLARVGTIVASMKDFSHPSHGEKVPVNIRDAINTTVNVARHEWKYVADVDVDIDSGLEAVPCLRDEMNQVYLNLIVNAAHAIAPTVEGGEHRGRVTISGRTEDGYACIRVTDTGTGIPAAIRHRIFEPFFTTKGVGRGTGQGLAIVYSVIVDKHHGSIDFETTEGTGTTFIVRIPLTQKDGART